MRLFLLPALLLAAMQAPDKPQASYSTPAETGCRPAPPPPQADRRRIADLLASTNGANAAAAFRVRSISEEYEILGALGLCPHMQALTQNGRRSYDVLTAIDPATGAARVLWFDITAFFGHEF